MQVTLCRQGTQEPGWFDEQPSVRKVYRHEIPAVYARCVDGLTIEGTVKLCKPYTKEENPLIEQVNCTGVVTDIFCQEE